MVGLRLGGARRFDAGRTLDAGEHERAAQCAAQLHDAHAEAEAFGHLIGGLLIQTNEVRKYLQENMLATEKERNGTTSTLLCLKLLS